VRVNGSTVVRWDSLSSSARRSVQVVDRMYIDNTKHKDVEITAIAIVQVHVVNNFILFAS
jgi:hypothetical protein